MNTLESRPGERVRGVRFTEDDLIVDLLDGRTISVPARVVSTPPVGDPRAACELASSRRRLRYPLARCR